MLSTAESCTGGGLGYALTAVPGSSAWYMGGVVSYSNEYKQAFLNVPASLLNDYGAVSSQVAVAMATGLSKSSGSQAAISVTGIAGPDGGSPTKPVGLVWLGSYDIERSARTKSVNISGNRSQIRNSAIQAAIEFFLSDL